uniref:Uncharacterized protein n=1 Tax=Zea mays TaxID=4577 RepID=A0A804PWG2_MAIZE
MALPLNSPSSLESRCSPPHVDAAAGLRLSLLQYLTTISFVVGAKSVESGVLWLSRDSRLFPLQTIKSLQTAGNMLHLIEACILRKLIDTSAYLWPGYVVPSGTLKDTALPQESPWLNFMKVSRLSGPLIDALVASPASSSSSAR